MKKRKTLVIIMASIVMIIIVATAVAAQGTSFYAAATIDGSDNEWDPESDYCVDMLLAGGQGGQDAILSTVCLRYDCISETLYSLVFATNDYNIIVDGSEEHWVKQGSDKLVDDQSGNDGVAPDFAWIGRTNGTAEGWEASCPLTDSLQADLVVHTLIWYENEEQTSATKPFSLEINCLPTAVGTLPDFTASVVSDPTATMNMMLVVGLLLTFFAITSSILFMIGRISWRKQQKLN